MWKNPILEFIDQHCLIFDEEDENKIEYTTIHNVRLFSILSDLFQKFKEIVDTKLDKFSKDMGIEPEIFVTACELASQKVHKSIVNQLLAVDSFLLFKTMMIARNKQLNHEASQ